MDKRKMINNLKQEFLLKRVRAQEDCDNFIENLKQDQTFNELYSNYTKKQLEYLRTRYEEENLALKHDVEDLKMEIDRFLTNKGIDKNKLKPQYECNICNDTGVVGGRICSCLLKALNQKISKQNSCKTNFAEFEKMDLSIMNETEIKASEILKKWCKEYPNVSKININILGNAGSGKTFMMECVANELTKKGEAISFKTAFEINELARLYHINRSFDFSTCLTTPVLFIDDLGTEPILNNVTKEYLYNLINVRQINKLPTFITTNLSADDILSRYDERIYSRLANKNLSINLMLNSSDKRIK